MNKEQEMGSSFSAIRDDEDDWSSLQDRAKISSLQNWQVYSREASFAKEGFNKGHKGETLIAYVAKECKKADLVSKMHKLDSDFEQLIKLRDQFK